jgi:hypothetical protein
MDTTATHRSTDVTSASAWAKMAAPGSLLREVGRQLDHRDVMLGRSDRFVRNRSRPEVHRLIVRRQVRHAASSYAARRTVIGGIRLILLPVP